MCNEACIIFVAKSLDRSLVQGRSVVELGSGGIGARPLLEAWRPRAYVGVDIAPGRHVDIVSPAEDVLGVLTKGAFDVVLSTEMLEHVRDWRRVISNIKALCASGGRVVLTTRSLGYPYHGAPWDFWRFEVGDMVQIFSDFQIELVEPDPQEPGVFLAAKKPEGSYTPCSLEGIALYSMVEYRRIFHIPDRPMTWWRSVRRTWGDRARRFARLVLETIRGRPPNIRFQP